MDIDPTIAQTIVANIKDVLKHEINFFDTSGSIIASTDASRIGTGHEGARLAVRLGRTVAIDNDHQYEGARNGINVPVLFNGSVVAVVGVTGKCEEVEAFGNVIRKMTEILIRENLDQITRFDQRMMMANVVTMLSIEHKDTALLGALASTLQIDLCRERRAVVGRLTAATGVARLGDRIYLALSQAEAHGVDLFSVTPQECCIFVDREDAASLKALLEDLDSVIADQCGTRVAWGMGECEPGYDDYWRSYDQASKASDWQLFTHSSGLADYQDLDYGIFAASIPLDEARRFVDHVFGTLDAARIEEFESIFHAYAQYNGSIIHAAESLFIHKNTLQNRLNSMASATGYNPRVLKDYAVLDTAFRIRDYVRFRTSGEREAPVCGPSRA